MSVSERAGKFGLADEQAGLGWFKENRPFGDEKELPLGVKDHAEE